MNDERDSSPCRNLASESDELAKYRIRFQLYKVLVGGLAVTAVSAIIPASVQLWTGHLESRREELRLNATERERQLALVEAFVTRGLEQDIEARIRFAEYMEYSVPEDAEPYLDEGGLDHDRRNRWSSYRAHLEGIRDTANQELTNLESQIVVLLDKSELLLEETIELAELERQVGQWRRRIGGAVHDRSRYQSARANTATIPVSENVSGPWRIAAYAPRELILYEGVEGDGEMMSVEVCNETNSAPHSNSWAWVILDDREPIQLRPAGTRHSGGYPDCIEELADWSVTVRRYETDPNIFVPVFGRYSISNFRAQ